MFKKFLEQYDRKLKQLQVLDLSWHSPGWSVPTASTSSLEQLNNFQLAPKYSDCIINISIIWEQWLRYSDACLFCYASHSKCKQIYCCVKLTSNHIVPELQQSENLLLCCNVLKQLVKQLALKLQHTDF